LLIDAAVTAGAARAELVATIARAAPFGTGNPEPVLALPAHVIAYADEVGQTHVRARLEARDGSMVAAIAFGAAGKPLGEALLRNRGQCVHVAGTLSLDRWQGDERVQLRLVDLASVDPAGAAHARRTGSRSRERKSYAVVSFVICVTPGRVAVWIYKAAADGSSRKPAAGTPDDATRRYGALEQETIMKKIIILMAL